jgi:hypothetical protein
MKKPGCSVQTRYVVLDPFVERLLNQFYMMPTGERLDFSFHGIRNVLGDEVPNCNGLIRSR